MENLIFFVVAIAGIEFVALVAAGVYLSRLLTKQKLAEIELNTIKENYKTNPSYDCQMLMADLLQGSGLFKIERIERENLFLRRR